MYIKALISDPHSWDRKTEPKEICFQYFLVNSLAFIKALSKYIKKQI